MEQKITVVYNPISQTVEIRENDFTNLEAFGVLEAAKVMIADHWINTATTNNGEVRTIA